MALEDQTKRAKLLKCENDVLGLNEEIHFGKTSFTMSSDSFFVQSPSQPTYARVTLNPESAVGTAIFRIRDFHSPDFIGAVKNPSIFFTNG